MKELQIKNNKEIKKNKSHNNKNHQRNKEKINKIEQKKDLKIIEIDKYKYQVLREKDGCLNIEELKSLYTDYFEGYDYILGDYSYDKLRLKGFCDKTNEKFNNINDIEKVEEYIENYCSYKANHFLLKKI